MPARRPRSETFSTRSPKVGRLRDAAPRLREETRFFVLGLAPNAARIAVRFWHEDTLGNLGRALRRALPGPAIEPSPGAHAARHLAAALRDRRPAQGREHPAHLAGEVMRAILTGRAIRARCSPPWSCACAPTARSTACARRSARPVSLATSARASRRRTYLWDSNRDEPDPAYRLGRLFAVLESVQRAALGNLNATIRDRYYGAASATPAAVFPMLLRTRRTTSRACARARAPTGSRSRSRPPAGTIGRSARSSPASSRSSRAASASRTKAASPSATTTNDTKRSPRPLRTSRPPMPRRTLTDDKRTEP